MALINKEVTSVCGAFKDSKVTKYKLFGIITIYKKTEVIV